LSKKLEHPGKYFLVKKSIKVCEGVRKINFLKVRTVLRGTVKSVTNVWKIKNIYTCLRVTRGVIYQFGNVVTNSLRMKIFYEFDSVIKVQKLEIHI